MRTSEPIEAPRACPSERQERLQLAIALRASAPRRKNLAALVLGTLLAAGVGACANPPAGRDRQTQAATSSQTSANWPTTDVAERDFATAAVVIDSRGTPSKLWLIAAPVGASAEAMEFFTGERVTGVEVERGADPSRPAARVTYSFTDREGRRYQSLRAIPSNVDADQPSTYAGWEQADGTGHDVVLGATLTERKTSNGPDGMPAAVNTPVDARPLFGGQSACDQATYVARTQGSQHQDTEPGFVPRTRVIAGYDAIKACWNTRPIHAVNLEDNTFLIATASRVFRISSKDLSSAGKAANIRIIDIKE